MHDRQLVQDYRKIRVWHDARAFKRRIYALVTRFPAHEQYALADQLRRSTRSISANIAEGFGKSSRWDCARCLQTSLSEAGEVLNHLFDALDLQFIDEPKFTELAEELRILQRRLGALYFRIRPSGKDRRNAKPVQRRRRG